MNLNTEFTEPVLRECPIPRHVVSYLGGYVGGRPRYLLWKDGKEITIEGPHYNYYAHDDPNDPYSQWRIIQMANKTFGHYLEIIQLLLTQIHFGETNWAYLLPDKYGGFYIRHREKIRPAITCPLWAPTISENEIQFTVWGQPYDRRGIWKGLEVDVFYTWCEENFIQIDRAMYACRLIAGLDLIFEVYGHLVRADGSVIGLVTEAAKGRMLRYSDRSLIYRTIASIQARGFLYRGCVTNQFLISPEGKVRLMELHSIVPYPRTQWDRLEKDANAWHWGELEILFDELKTYGQFGKHCTRRPPDRLTINPNNLTLIAPLPSPERPLGGLYIYPSADFFLMQGIPMWDGYVMVSRAKTSRYNHQSRREAITEHPHSSSETDFSTAADTNDGPLSVLTVSFHRFPRGAQRRARIAAHPYKNGDSRNENAVSASEDTGTL